MIRLQIPFIDRMCIITISVLIIILYRHIPLIDINVLWNMIGSLLVYLFKLLVLILTSLFRQYLLDSFNINLILMWTLIKILLDFFISLIILSIDFEVFRIIEVISLITIIFFPPMVLWIVSILFCQIDSLLNIISILLFNWYIDIFHELFHSGHEITMIHIKIHISIINVLSE